MIKNIRSAFTLVEIIVVAGCLALILGPAFMILRSSGNVSRKGMLRVETTLESRRVLKQIYSDLKQAIIPWPLLGPPSKKLTPLFTDIVYESGQFPEKNYSFYSFPANVPFADDGTDGIIDNRSMQGFADRNVASITYIVEQENNNLLRLKRVQDYKGKRTERILSKRVNFFQIKPIYFFPPMADKEQYFFCINLQLIDYIHPSVAQNNAGNNNNIPESQFVIADFFEVVYPDYWQVFINSEAYSPSWHTCWPKFPDIN